MREREYSEKRDKSCVMYVLLSFNMLRTVK